MNKATLGGIRNWMEQVADGFISQAPVNQDIPLILKRAHSLRVAADARTIAARLQWEDADINLAEAIGLVHDIARFGQYAEFRTFSDAVSYDHGEKAYEIANDSQIIRSLPSDAKDILLTSVRYHNRKDMPAGLPDDHARHLKLIRDADKIDILLTVSQIIREGWHFKYPGVLLDVDIDGPVTPALLTQILETNTGGYENVKSLADIHLMRIAWIYAINYRPALRMLMDRSLLEETAVWLPDTPEIRTIQSRARNYLSRELSAGL